VEPAVAHRIPVAWINRKGMPATDGVKPDLEFRTVVDFAEWLAPADRLAVPVPGPG